MTLDSTISGTASDSYVTIAEYVTYGAALGWDLETVEAMNEANLRRATQYLDRVYHWVGRRTETTQKLAWPRILDHSENPFDDRDFDYDQIPQPIKDAQCELAYIFQSGVDLFASVTVPENEEIDASARPIAIEGLVAPFGASRTGTIKLYRT